MDDHKQILIIIGTIILLLIGYYLESLAPLIYIIVGIGAAYLLFKEGREVIVKQQDDYIHEKRMERKKEEDRKREVDILKKEIDDLKNERNKKI